MTARKVQVRLVRGPAAAETAQMGPTVIAPIPTCLWCEDELKPYRGDTTQFGYGGRNLFCGTFCASEFGVAHAEEWRHLRRADAERARALDGAVPSRMPADDRPCKPAPAEDAIGGIEFKGALVGLRLLPRNLDDPHIMFDLLIDGDGDGAGDGAGADSAKLSTAWMDDLCAQLRAARRWLEKHAVPDRYDTHNQRTADERCVPVGYRFR